MASVFINSEDNEVELLDLTADDDAGFLRSSPALGNTSCGGDSNDTLIDYGTRELKLIPYESLTSGTLSGEDTIMNGDTGEKPTMLKRKPLSNVDIPIQTLPISMLREPPLCKEYPDRRNEILQLFLRRTTFIAEVWTNYTAAEWPPFKDGEEFFHDEVRVHDCGKLQLRSRGALKRIKHLNHREFEMMKVKLVVGTPFRPLFHLLLVMSDGRLVVKRDDVADGAHTELHKFVGECCHEIRSADLVYGEKGVTVQDLEYYASLFVSRYQSVNMSLYPDNASKYCYSDNQSHQWHWL